MMRPYTFTCIRSTIMSFSWSNREANQMYYHAACLSTFRNLVDELKLSMCCQIIAMQKTGDEAYQIYWKFSVLHSTEAYTEN